MALISKPGENHWLAEERESRLWLSDTDDFGIMMMMPVVGVRRREIQVPRVSLIDVANVDTVLATL